MELPPETTLADAKRLLKAKLEDGTDCPCCTQFAKIYPRQIHSTIARALIRMWQLAQRGYVHVAHDISPACEAGKARYWGLVEEHPETSGLWRLTVFGESFVRGAARVPKYAQVYDGRCLGLAGDLVSIHDTLGKKFDYAELMATRV